MSGPTAPARPESSARPGAPEPALAGSPSASASAATTERSAADRADRETSGTAVTAADQAVPAVTGGPPATSGAGATESGATESGATKSGATESGATESGAAVSAIRSDGAHDPKAATGGGAASEGVQDSTQASVQVLVVPGIARFHQADCILIRFLGEDDLQRMSRAEAEATGCAACRACRP
jgi:hypothetical protein